MAVLAAAEAKNSPVIMQTTPGTIKYAGVDYYYANVAAAAKRSSVPVVMHLDHGDSFQRAMAAYRAGYTSIMIDGSKLPFEDNIDLTKRVVDACHPGDVYVEGELGKVVRRTIWRVMMTIHIPIQRKPKSLWRKPVLTTWLLV